MLCAYCRLFDFRSMAAEVIANWRDPLPSADYDNYGSNLFKYHSTLIGVHSAIAEGCGLCSLFWETWLENSQNWRWEEDIFSDEEGDMNRTADFKLAISKNLESFAPSLSFGLCHVSPNFGSKVGNMQNGDESIKISEERIVRRATIGVSFKVRGNHKFLDQLLFADVMLGICAKLEDKAVTQGCLEVRERSLTPDYELAKKWLQTCLGNHRCGPSNAIPRLPTRVIEIGQSASDLRLLESRGRYGKYTALSHCWGTSPIWTTTIKNQELPHYSKLPGNFQDAITVTRNLGLQYLWIDSLCILQDSADDWEIECANMANIYRNAEFTISVRENTSSSPGGFLQDAGCKPYKSCQLDGLTISNQPIDWPNKSPIPFGGVDRRGWILQERLLSARLLHFGKQMMRWECCRHTCYEGLHHPVHTSGGRRNPEYVKKFALNLLEPTDTKSVYSYWYEIVHDYSGRQLTKDIDKLPALSGLALVFGGVLKDTYLAGLWENDFAWGLCWNVTRARGWSPLIRDAPHYKPVGQWTAPSWSWASNNHRAQWPSRVTPWFRERLSVQSVYTRSIGHDHYGVIDSASLIVVGKMKTGFVDLKFCFDASGGSLGTHFFDDEITDVSQLENTTVVEKNTGRGLMRFGCVSLLLVVTTRFGFGTKESTRQFYDTDHCLLLTPGPERNTYRRIGLIRTKLHRISPESGAATVVESSDDIIQGERWSEENSVRHSWFDDAKEQEIILV